MTSCTVDIDGPVHYIDHGGPRSEGTLVLVHGLGGSHVNWGAVAPLLAEKHRVLAVDLAGFGRTPLAHRLPTVEANAALLARFVDRVAREPVTLVGNSMGGLLSIMAAAASPKSVRSLVLVDAAHPPARGVWLDREVALVFAMYMLPWVGEYVMRTRAKTITPEQLVRETMRVCCADPGALHPSIIDAHVALAHERKEMEWAHDAFLAATRSLVRILVTPRRVERLANQIAVPTLVLHGDRDRLVPVGSARAAAKRHGWELEIFHGVGHVPQLEIPERFVEVVDRFLSAHGEGAVNRQSVPITS